jgi:hypothetical protein
MRQMPSNNFDTELDQPTLAMAGNLAKRMIRAEMNLRLLLI